MKAADRDAEMTRFRDGELDVLVGTTVVEVGVDVPEATMMVIEGADRFGLAQLHQLRGRVGRGTVESFCVLVSDSTDEVAQARLKAVAETARRVRAGGAGLRAAPRGRRARAWPRAGCRGCGSRRSRTTAHRELAVRARAARRGAARRRRADSTGGATRSPRARRGLAGARRAGEPASARTDAGRDPSA